MMSQQAISIAATAHIWICAPSEYTSRIRCCDDDLDLKGIHPEDERRQFVDRRFHGLAEVIQSAFADAVNAFIGRDLANSQFFQGFPAMKVSTAVIFISFIIPDSRFWTSRNSSCYYYCTAFFRQSPRSSLCDRRFCQYCFYSVFSVGSRDPNPRPCFARRARCRR